MTIPRINHAALEYWKQSKYTSADIDLVCSEVDNKWMVARVTFQAPGIQMALSKRTWERQEGHYPTVAKFFQDISNHPLLKNRRGSIIVWLEDGLWDSERNFTLHAPVFAFGRHVRDTRTLLIPDPAFMESRGYLADFADNRTKERELPWHKKIPTAFWRGAASGLGIESYEWNISPRGRLVLRANEVNDLTKIDAKLTRLGHLEPAQQEIMRSHGVVGEPVDFSEFLKYRYQIDADGYCCAWKSLLLKLATQGVLLKLQSEYEQWYHWDLIPWKHYIPLRLDVRDFEEAYSWLRAHDKEAQVIGQQGNEFAHNLLYDQTLEDAAQLCSAILNCQMTKDTSHSDISAPRYN